MDAKTLSGVASIKEEYVIHVEQETSLKRNDGLSSNEDVASNPSKKMKKSGKFQNRPKLIKEAKCNKLCRSHWSLLPGEINDHNPCQYPECCFSHDIQKFLDNKPKDIGETCHNFITYGYCPYGVTCRFGSKHIDNLGSLRNNDQYLTNPPVTNILKKEVQNLLRKKKYDFTKASAAFKSFKNKSNQNGQNSSAEMKPEHNPSEHSEPIQTNGSQALKSVLQNESSECIFQNKDLEKLSEGKEDYGFLKKKIDWNGKLYLAPLTTLGNLPFRRVCKRLGADITCGEMALATCLLQGSPSEWSLVKKHSIEDCFGVQLCGSNVESMIRCAQLLEEQINLDFIDINMGCPIDLIYKQGGGSALMRRTEALEHMVRGMSKVISCPLTLKMRTGVKSTKNVAHDILERAKLWDISLVTLHGRSREQRFLKMANWDYIDECAKIASPLPLFGNGDILTHDNYYQRVENMSITGTMIARGALIKPWIFTEIKEKRSWDISSSERLDIIKEYANYGLEHWGSDSEGVEKTRRFLLEWLSFLYRYIPVGLLERPQMINQRPPPYYGRNDLETLMASNKVNDWVNISEMLLGPVPENFDFFPKHQSNSWT